MERQATSYDELPYSSHPLAAGHPENLACKALLHGLRPAAVENCRLLELGCSTGGNLIPLGELLPNAEFVGLDHAARQIARGRAIVESLGLSNVDLRTLSFEEVDEKLHGIMKGIHQNAYAAAEKYGCKGNYVMGANIAGFKKVADAMMAQGIV